MAANDPLLMPTADHVHPRSKGGQRVVWACWICNNIKGDMLLPAWEAYMAANPRWWERKARANPPMTAAETVKWLRECGESSKA